MAKQAKQLYEGPAKNSRGRWPILHLSDEPDPKLGAFCGRDFGPKGTEPTRSDLAHMIPSTRGGAYCRECVQHARGQTRKGPEGLANLLRL